MLVDNVLEDQQDGGDVIEERRDLDEKLEGRLDKDEIIEEKQINDKLIENRQDIVIKDRQLHEDKVASYIDYFKTHGRGSNSQG